MYGPLGFLVGLASSVPYVLDVDTSSVFIESTVLGLISLTLWMVHHLKNRDFIDILSTGVSIVIQLYILYNVFKEKRKEANLLVDGHSVPTPSAVDNAMNKPQ